VVLVLTLGGGDEPKPTPPDPPEPEYFNPYKVIESDAAAMSYKMERISNI